MLENRLKIINNFFLKRTRISSMPIEISIGVTNACNSKCKMCPRTKRNNNIGFMEYGVFKKIIDESKDYLELVYLHMDGEPLLNPDIFKFIKYAKNKNIFTSFSTNGILLNEERAIKILDSMLDYLIISIDATTPETYKKIKGVNKYKIVEENVKKFIKLKRQYKKPYVIVQLIALDENKKEWEEFKRKWANSGVDAVRIKPALNFGSSVDVGKRKFNTNPCFLLWRQMAFYWDGTAVACCLDFYGESKLGNIKNKSLRELWNSNEMIKIRHLHKTKNIQDINMCANCNVSEFNPIFLYLGSLFNNFTIKRALISYEKIKNIKS